MGTATLYRNFPTREALVEEAYRNEVARLRDVVPELLAAQPPYEALRAWTRLFMDYATAKLGMADALRAIAASGSNPYAHSHDMIRTAIAALMDACAEAGAIRSDIGPTDMFAALAGIALTSAKPEQREQAERLLDLTLDGLRPLDSRGVGTPTRRARSSAGPRLRVMPSRRSAPPAAGDTRAALNLIAHAETAAWKTSR